MKRLICNNAMRSNEAEREGVMRGKETEGEERRMKRGKEIERGGRRSSEGKERVKLMGGRMTRENGNSEEGETQTGKTEMRRQKKTLRGRKSD